MKMKYVLPLVIFLALAIFLMVGLNRDPREVPSPLIGKPAPEFSLPRLDDPNKVVSKKDMLGQVWLLNVWSSWCGSCRQEHTKRGCLSCDRCFWNIRFLPPGTSDHG